MPDHESPPHDPGYSTRCVDPVAAARLSLIASRDLPELRRNLARAATLVEMELAAVDDLFSMPASASMLRGQASAVLQIARLHIQHVNLLVEAADLVARQGPPSEPKPPPTPV